MKVLILLMGSLFFMSCAYSVHDYHVSDYDLGMSTKSSVVIESKSEKFIVLGFSNDVDYVKEAYDDLLSKCPDGNITGIHTRFSTDLGFLSYTQKIKMTASCY